MGVVACFFSYIAVRLQRVSSERRRGTEDIDQRKAICFVYLDFVPVQN